MVLFSGGDRRNKSVQQKAMKAAGLRAVREACGKTYSEVSAFVENESFSIVVKSVESCGSDGVKICRTTNEVRDHVTLLMEGQRKVGAQSTAVLCQEFLKGTEYVVDHVSRDGVHKTMMVWVTTSDPPMVAISFTTEWYQSIPKAGRRRSLSNIRGTF